MDIFLIFRSKKPLKENEDNIELIGQTKNAAKAALIASQSNHSELKKTRDDGRTVNGNRELTEVFTKEELNAAKKALIEELTAKPGDIPL